MNARGRNPTARCRQAGRQGKATSRGIEQSGQMRGGDERECGATCNRGAACRNAGVKGRLQRKK